MKKVLIFLSCLFISGSIYAGKPLGAEAPIRTGSIAPECVSISTSVWTVIPSSTTGNTAGRMGFEINNPASNTSNVHGFRTNSTSAPSDDVTAIRVVELAPSSATSFLGYSDETYLWLVSQNATAEDVCVQEVTQ